jgi:hypothetical protein
VWDPATGREVERFAGKLKGVVAGFSLDGAKIHCADRYGLVSRSGGRVKS